MSGGVMSNVALDAALDELGMLSTITNSRQEYIAEQLSRLASLDILQNHSSDPRGTNSGMRSRASSMSTVSGRVPGVILKRTTFRIKPYRFELRPTRSRTKSENESDVLDLLPSCSTNQRPSHHSPVPYIALPIDSVFSSNLFKSRSMESIDPRASDESVVMTNKEEISETIANLQEVDSVSSGLHRLNVSE